MYLKEKIQVSAKLHSGMTYSAWAMTSMLMNQQYILNMASVNIKNTQNKVTF